MQVDDEVRQDGNTRDMMYKLPFLISYISSIMTLEPGDVILTGMGKRSRRQGCSPHLSHPTPRPFLVCYCRKHNAVEKLHRMYRWFRLAGVSEPGT